jgi:hypothetical protein
VTLTTFITLAKAFRALDVAAVAQLDLVLDSRADDATPDGLARVRDWIQAIGLESGTDEQLSDAVGCALTYVRAALQRIEDGDDAHQ